MMSAMPNSTCGEASNTRMRERNPGSASVCTQFERSLAQLGTMTMKKRAEDDAGDRADAADDDADEKADREEHVETVGRDELVHERAQGAGDAGVAWR